MRQRAARVRLNTTPQTRDETLLPSRARVRLHLKSLYVTLNEPFHTRCDQSGLR